MRATSPTIPYNSSEAAVYESRLGWWSRTGHYWKDDEHMARYDGCTHRQCACGASIEKSRSICIDCQVKKDRERWEARPRRAYAGEPLAVDGVDLYYWNWDDVLEGVAGGEITDDTMLVFADPQHGRPVDAYDLLCDDLPAEDGEVPDAIVEAVNALNDAIKNAGPLSWIPGNTVPTFTPEQHREIAAARGERR